jgi:peptide/nickel transport system ATP-binding protein/oligopeptide transport system ATP-binding protein
MPPTDPLPADPILTVRDLRVDFATRRGTVTILDDVAFDLRQGECLGLVGESGSGKSMTCRALLGLVPAPGRVVAGEVRFEGQDLLTLPEARLNRLRGRDIAMIVQDAVAALNPVWRIGAQIGEAMLHHGVVSSRTEARTRAIELMRRVGIPDPERRIDDYPHQFSGGMCQRVVIAAALACAPRILIADEPTTALDVTIQDQILKLLLELQKSLDLSVILVTHDMGVVAQSCQRVAVMYGGEIVEMAETGALFRQQRHPYTMGLLACLPRLDETGPVARLAPIPGMPPDLADPPRGCRFHPRCPLATDRCRRTPVPLTEAAPGHFTRCLHHAELSARPDLWQAAEAVP